MQHKLLLTFFIVVFQLAATEGQTRIDIAEKKQCLKRIVHWKDKGLVFMLRGETETTFYFVNSTGAIGWKHDIPHTEYPHNRATSVFDVNSKYMYLAGFLNYAEAEYSELYFYMVDESGQVIKKKLKFDHYHCLFSAVTEEGLTVVMKDLGRKEMSREFRTVTFSDLSGEQTSSTDLELPQGTWKPYGTFQNNIVVKTESMSVDDNKKMERDTFCFLEPSGKLFNMCLIDIDYQKYEFISHPTYYFDNDEKCIYAYVRTVKTKEKDYTGFQINKYDANGKLIQSFNKWFDELVAFSPEFEKKGFYKDLDVNFFNPNNSWGGICFELEKSLDPKKMLGVVVSFSGEVRQTIVMDYWFINQKYYDEIRPPVTPDCHLTYLNEYSTIFATGAKASSLENGEPLNKISKINANKNPKKPVAFYSYEKVGGENLILEYFPKEAYIQIYH